MSSPKLFQPATVGDIMLKHRVVMAPLTRFRNDASHVPVQPRPAIYYGQRGSVPGTLIISGATLIAQKAGGYTNAPGIWSDENVAARRQTTDAVHAKGSYIVRQLWAPGRPERQRRSSARASSASARRTSPSRTSTAPRRARSPSRRSRSTRSCTRRRQRMQWRGPGSTGWNPQRERVPAAPVPGGHERQPDGRVRGNAENKARFLLAAVEAVREAVGQKKTGVRLSPWTSWHDSRSPLVVPTYSYIVKQLRERFPDLACLHVIEPRSNAPGDALVPREGESNDFIRELWRGKTLITAGGHTPESALQDAENSNELFAFGRLFVSNPDLPYRIQHGIPARKGDRATYFTTGDEGYADYPFSAEFIAEHGL